MVPWQPKTLWFSAGRAPRIGTCYGWPRLRKIGKEVNTSTSKSGWRRIRLHSGNRLMMHNLVRRKMERHLLSTRTGQAGRWCSILSATLGVRRAASGGVKSETGRRVRIKMTSLAINTSMGIISQQYSNKFKLIQTKELQQFLESVRVRWLSHTSKKILEKGINKWKKN